MRALYLSGMSPPFERVIKLGRPATWNDLDRVPEGYVGEIVAGDIVVTRCADSPEMDAASKLLTLIGTRFNLGIDGPGGWWIFHKPRIRFESDTMRVPDLGAWRKERYAAPRRGPLTVVPDWICEILSPSTARMDRADKMPLYAAHGVRHCWILDPVLQILEVFRNNDRMWSLVATHVADAKARIEPFDAVELDLTLVWGPAREIVDGEDE